VPSIETIALVASVLLIISIVASKASERLGVPALLAFVGIGMLAGSEGPGGIPFSDPWLAQAVGVLALALILFSGGVDTDWHFVRPALLPGATLATAGVVVSAAVLGTLVHLILAMPLLQGLLLGAIVSSTDAAAVFAVLRARNVGLQARLKSLLELESGSNDPMAVFLTTAMIQTLTEPSSTVGSIVVGFLVQMIIGAGAGYLLGRGTVVLVNHLRLQYEGLYPVLTLALALLTYGATAWLGGNGFLAVYVAGLVVGNSDFIHKRSLIRFHDGLAWLMQIAMFLVLGLLAFPSHLVAVTVSGLITAALLMLVARPVSVFLVLALFAMSLREKTMVAWVGLRGAVPIVLATFPLLAGVPDAHVLFDLVFFVVLTSVLLQGTSIPAVARWLGVDAPIAEREHELPVTLTGSPRGRLEEIPVVPRSRAIGRRILELGVPRGSLVVLLRRGDEVLIPDGGTALQEGDRVVVLADEAMLPTLRGLLAAAAPQDGADGAAAGP
jgi:cell volume regulation protein A